MLENEISNIYIQT